MLIISFSVSPLKGCPQLMTSAQSLAVARQCLTTTSSPWVWMALLLTSLQVTQHESTTYAWKRHRNAHVLFSSELCTWKWLHIVFDLSLNETAITWCNSAGSLITCQCFTVFAKCFSHTYISSAVYSAAGLNQNAGHLHCALYLNASTSLLLTLSFLTPLSLY